MNKYVEVPKNDKNHEVENSWFRHCRKNEIPFITLKSRTKFADVHWDYITYPTEVDKVLKRLGNQLRDSAIEIFKKYANERSTYTANGSLVWYRNIEISKAKIAAEELYDLISNLVEKKASEMA